MKTSKNLALLFAVITLSACSSSEEKSSFMSFGELQDKVREHDAQLETTQVRLDRIDELEAEVAALKQGDMTSNSDVMTSSTKVMMDAPKAVMSDSGVAVINVAPVITTDPMLSESEINAVESATLVSAPAEMKALEYGVQVASYRNHDEAVRGWNVLLKTDATSYEGLEPLINQKSINGQTMYQLKVGPFSNKLYSTDFCQMLKNKGGDCLVTQYNGDAFSAN